MNPISDANSLDAAKETDLSRLDVPDVDALVLVQWDGLPPQHHVHAGGGDVLQGAAQHPAVPGPPVDAAPPRALRPPLLLFLILVLLLVLLALAERTGEREVEEGEKG